MLIRELTERRVDLLIARRYSAIADERLDYEFLFDDPYSVAVGMQNPLARRRSIELAELVNEPWVLPPRESPLGSVAMEAFRASGLDYPRTVVIGEPVEMRTSLLATGRYVTIFAGSVFRFSAGGSELKVLPVKQSLSSVPVGIVILKNRTLTPVVQLFVDSAREVGKQLAKTR